MGAQRKQNLGKRISAKRFPHGRISLPAAIERFGLAEAEGSEDALVGLLEEASL